MRKTLKLLIVAAALVPGCSKSSSDDPAPNEFFVHYVRQGNLAQAWVGFGNWNGGQFLDSGLTAWSWIPAKSIAGTTVSFPYGLRFVVYIKNNILYRYDFAAGNVVPISTEANAGAIIALVDTDAVATSAATTYVVYTTNPAGGFMDLKAARVSGPGATAPAMLEAGIPDTDTHAVRVPRDGTNVFYYASSSATTSVKRCNLAAYPTASVDVMTAADDVLEWLVRDSTSLVYRRATGELRRADISSPPVAITTLLTPAGNETLALRGKIDLGADSEVFYTSHVDTDADLVADQVSLRRVLWSTGAGTLFAGPFSYATLSLNRVVFTAGRVVWEHVRDTTSYITSFDRVTPGGGTSLLTGGRSLDPSSSTFVIYDPAGFRLLFTETMGGTIYRVTKTDLGGLVAEYTFAGTPGPTQAINHLGSSYYDAALDLAAAMPTARLVFVDGTALRSLRVDMSAGTQANIGSLPGDITQFVLTTAYRGPTCIGGTTTPPPQTDIFFFHADGGGSLLRQTTSIENESALAAH